MNPEHILMHLKEAKEELDRTIAEIEKDKEYDVGAFFVAISNIYNHLNTAWNARDATEKEAVECSEENFKKWRKFPTDLDFS